MDQKDREEMLQTINPAWHSLSDEALVILYDGLLVSFSALKLQPTHALAGRYISTYGDIKHLGLRPLEELNIRQQTYPHTPARDEEDFCVDFEYRHPRFDKIVYDHVVVENCKNGNEAEWTVREYIMKQFEWHPAPVEITIKLLTPEMPRYSVKRIPSLTEMEKALETEKERNSSKS
jgi:hypothetical protein